MKYLAVIVLLWAIALAATLWLVQEANTRSHLAPVYFICLVGSVLTVRHAVRGRVP